MIHIENSYASGQRKRPRGPRPDPTVEPNDLSSKTSLMIKGHKLTPETRLELPELVSNCETTDDLNNIFQRPLVDLKTQATMYYMHYHLKTLQDALNISKGISDDILPIWMSSAESPILDLAVSSMALAVFSRTQHHPPAAREASMKYHRLLQVVQVTIISLNEGNVDASLLAIYFMSRYEDVIHRPRKLNPNTPFATTLQSFLHHDGALAILKVWKDRLSHSQPATDVIKHTRRGMIRSALLRNLALPEWMLQGTLFGERGLELEYDCIVVRIANVRQRLAMLLKEKKAQQCTSNDPTSTAEELNGEARDIDKALQDWTSHFPSTWCHQGHTLSNSDVWPTKDFYSEAVYSYSSPAYAAVWIQYYASRMLINSTRLRILRLSRTNSDDFAFEQRLKCLSHISSMAHDLASSVPFCLQRFKVTDSLGLSSHRESVTLTTNEDIQPYIATLTVWPLGIASSLADVNVKQKTWFRSVLARLGRVVAVGVFECAETDHWLEL